MRKLLLTVLLVASFFIFKDALAGYVVGYYRSNGTYVQPYYRSNPNGLKFDNYSYRGGSLYNDSYGTRSYSWNTPSWNTQSDYFTGYNSYRSYNRGYNSYLGY